VTVADPANFRYDWPTLVRQLSRLVSLLSIRSFFKSCRRRTRQAWAGECPCDPIFTVALGSSPPDNGGWRLPIEPLLGVRHAQDAWAPALAALQLRAR
jgi:hypothetical protein